MSIYTSIIKYFTLSVSEYVATNVSEKNKLHFYANQIHAVP